MLPGHLHHQVFPQPGEELADVSRRGAAQRQGSCYGCPANVLVIREMVSVVVEPHEDIDWCGDGANHFLEGLLELLKAEALRPVLIDGIV
jgi:hypothetical protein